MLAIEYRCRNESQIGRRAKSARRTSAFTKPKASAPKLHHPDVATSKSKTPEQKRSRVLELPISNGASPVASALGIRLGATPRGPHQPNMASPARLSKQDISTLLGIGHFYFALTWIFRTSSTKSVRLRKCYLFLRRGENPGSAWSLMPDEVKDKRNRAS